MVQQYHDSATADVQPLEDTLNQQLYDEILPQNRPLNR